MFLKKYHDIFFIKLVTIEIVFFFNLLILYNIPFK